MMKGGGLNVIAMAVAASVLGGCTRSSEPPVDQSKAAQSKAAVPGTAAPTQTQPVNEDAKALAGFLERVNQYATLHLKLENTLPKLSKESTPEQVDAHQRKLALLIQDARKDAKQGDIFTPESQAVVKKLIGGIFSGPD